MIYKRKRRDILALWSGILLAFCGLQIKKAKIRIYSQNLQSYDIHECREFWAVSWPQSNTLKLCKSRQKTAELLMDFLTSQQKIDFNMAIILYFTLRYNIECVTENFRQFFRFFMATFLLLFLLLFSNFLAAFLLLFSNLMANYLAAFWQHLATYGNNLAASGNIWQF